MKQDPSLPLGMTPPALAMTPLALGITTPVSGGFRVIRVIAVRQATA